MKGVDFARWKREALPDGWGNLAKLKEIENAAAKTKKVKKNKLGPMSLTLLERIWDAQSFPREAQELPKSSQNGAKNVKK